MNYFDKKYIFKERPDVMKGRVKLPFKKKERKSADQKVYNWYF